MSRRKRERNRTSNDKAAVTGLGLSDVSVEPAQGSEDQQLSVGVFQRTARLIRTHWIVSATVVLACFVVLGVFAKNGWFPHTDAVSGKKTGWFGRQLPQNASSAWNPLAAPLPSPTPQLSKEFLYAGSRLLAVEDANANATPPADLAVWRPSSGYFYVLGGPGSAQTFYQWGTCATPGTTNCDVPVPGDFDGDGKTDFSVFRPSTGVWWVTKSSDTTFYSYQFGVGTDLPAQADYDGDGRTDIAVWRPSTGVWYIVQSSNGGTVYATYGTNGDKPAPADYDGDGRADIAVWRSSNKTFYSVNSSNNGFASFTFEQSSTEPVSADYDGDGRADYAIRNGNNWIVRNSSSPTTPPVIIPWEQSTDKAVQNDYDGDGKVDIAVWRDSNGNWYIRKSASNGQLRQEAWGMSGDIPVPAFYRR